MSINPTQPLPFEENLSAPEAFASEASSFATGPGVVTITFTSFRFDNSTDPAVQKRVVIARLVMPTAGAQALAVGLYDFLKQSGLDPAPPPADPQQIQ
jgi:hypothetical protein